VQGANRLATCFGCRRLSFSQILDARQGLFCFLAKNCDHGDYNKVVEGLCKEHNTHLIRVADKIQLVCLALCGSSFG
jgi:ribosomal protein L7Ae-like RNA K-turn-binding protein